LKEILVALKFQEIIFIQNEFEKTAKKILSNDKKEKERDRGSKFF
jgi:hypothetical protein